MIFIVAQPMGKLETFLWLLMQSIKLLHKGGTMGEDHKVSETIHSLLVVFLFCSGYREMTTKTNMFITSTRILFLN